MASPLLRFYFGRIAQKYASKTSKFLLPKYQIFIYTMSISIITRSRGGKTPATPP